MNKFLILALIAFSIACTNPPPPPPPKDDYLLYRGGKVILHPKVHELFWGSYFENGVGYTESEHLTLFFLNVGATPYFNIATQYYQDINHQANQPDNDVQVVGNDVLPLDPTTTTIDNGAIQEMIMTQIGSHTPDEDTIYFVFTPPGVKITSGGESSCTDFCGYHWSFIYNNSNVRYAVINHPDCNGCRAGIGSDVDTTIEADSKTEVSSHELIEAVTDPDGVSGWLDKAGDEIGDKCNWSSFVSTLNGSKYVVQRMWSNSADGCVEKE